MIYNPILPGFNPDPCSHLSFQRSEKLGTVYSCAYR